MLYHAEIGFPADIKLPAGIYPLRYTGHARRQAEGDRYGNCSGKLPAYLNTANAELIEVEINGRLVNKAVYRLSLTSSLDICLVVLFERCILTVKTVWINEKSDSHRTLNRSKYAVA